MLDVHPAPHAAHTWTDFFIHIATIVLGLVIAVGLEQTVEYLHHRHQAEQAREELGRELEANREVARVNTFELNIHEKNLRADLGVLHRVRTHSSVPGDRLLFHCPTRIFSDVYWKSAADSGAATYLSADERARYGFDYLQQDRFNTMADEAQVALDNTAAVLYDENTELPQPRVDNPIVFSDKFTHSEDATEQVIAAATPTVDLSHLTSAQIDQLEAGIQEAIARDERMLNTLGIIQRRQQRYAESN